MLEVGEGVDHGGLVGEERGLGTRLVVGFGAFGGWVAFQLARVHWVVDQQLVVGQGETLGLAWLKVAWP